MERSEADQIGKKKLFLEGIRLAMETYNITLDRLYNADQTSLFFNKLPKRMCISICDKYFCWVKQMKSKDREMLMVATSAVGHKILLFIVGKSKDQCMV
jgi:hypothetical protein